jgi:hypothetical protein
MLARLAIAGTVLALVAAAPAHGQITIDAAKITCEQFVHSKVGPTRSIGLWLSGFYNGRRDARTLDLQAFEAHLGKLEQFCSEQKNFNLPVMQAIEQTIGK